MAMTYRAIRLFVLAPILSVSIGVTPSAGQPQATAAPLIEQKNKASAKVKEEPTPSPARAALKQKFTWDEIESILDKLRKERKTRPQAYDDLRSWYSYLSSPTYSMSEDIPTHCTKLEEWRKHLPKSPTPLVVLAKAHLAHAWEARGDGFADTVTAAGRDLFHARVKESLQFVTQAIEFGIKDGEACSLLLEIATAEGAPLEQARAILGEGRKIDSTYFAIYTKMAIYLLPRWHGEPGDVEKFASETLATIPGDDGLEAFGQIAYSINSFDNDLIFWGGYDRKALGKAAVVLAQRYPDARNLPCFAALCTIAANDHAAARLVRPFVHHSDAPRVPLWEDHSAKFLEWSSHQKVPAGESDWVFGSHSSSGNLDFVPNSKLIWCGQGYLGRPVALLNPATKSVEMTLEVPQGGGSEFAYDPEKNWVASILSGDEFEGWCLWDLANPENPRSFPVVGGCGAIAINPKRRQIAWTAGKTLHTIDVETSAEGPEIKLDAGIQELRYSADGELLAVRTMLSAAVWNPITGQQKYSFAANEPKNRCESVLDFDEQGRIWAVAGSRGIGRYSADGKNCDKFIPTIGSDADYTSARLSPDRKLVAVPVNTRDAKGSHTIDIWDLSSGKKKKTLPGHWDDVYRVAFSSDSKTLASIGISGGVIKLWSIEETPADPALIKMPN